MATKTMVETPQTMRMAWASLAPRYRGLIARAPCGRLARRTALRPQTQDIRARPRAGRAQASRFEPRLRPAGSGALGHPEQRDRGVPARLEPLDLPAHREDVGRMQEVEARRVLVKDLLRLGQELGAGGRVGGDGRPAVDLVELLAGVPRRLVGRLVVGDDEVRVHHR